MITNVTADQIRAWPVNEDGWHMSPDTSDWIKIGSYAKIGSQEHVLHAHVLKYIANAYRVKDGSLILRYGCETRPFAEWTPEAIETMSARHEPSRAKEIYGSLARVG